MEKKISFAIIFLSLLFSINNISAQGRFHISVNGGYTFPIGGGEYYSNLKGGKNLNFNLSYSLFPMIESNLEFGYSYIPDIHRSDRGIAYNYWQPVYPSYIANPDFYQASFGIRVINPLARIRAFIDAGTGLYFLTKDLNVSLSSGNSATRSIYEKFYRIGFGFILPLYQQLDLSVEGRYESTFTGNQSFFPTIFGVRYNF